MEPRYCSHCNLVIPEDGYSYELIVAPGVYLCEDCYNEYLEQNQDEPEYE